MEQHRSARTLANIYLPLAASVIETALPPVDTPDMEACSLSQTFFLFVSSSFISSPCHQSFSTIHPSLWTSLIISQHPKIDVLDTEVCPVSLSPTLSVCLQPFPLSSIISHLKLIHWLQHGPFSLS